MRTIKRVSSLMKGKKMAAARWNSLLKPVLEDWMTKAFIIKKEPGNIDTETKIKLIDQHTSG